MTFYQALNGLLELFLSRFSEIKGSFNYQKAMNKLQIEGAKAKSRNFCLIFNDD